MITTATAEVAMTSNIIAGVIMMTRKIATMGVIAGVMKNLTVGTIVKATGAIANRKHTIIRTNPTICLNLLGVCLSACLNPLGVCLNPLVCLKPPSARLPVVRLLVAHAIHSKVLLHLV